MKFISSVDQEMETFLKYSTNSLYQDVCQHDDIKNNA